MTEIHTRLVPFLMEPMVGDLAIIWGEECPPGWTMLRAGCFARCWQIGDQWPYGVTGMWYAREMGGLTLTSLLEWSHTSLCD